MVLKDESAKYFTWKLFYTIKSFKHIKDYVNNQ